jgi:thiazole synthase
MAIVFKEFQELIERGLQNNMPQEAKLIILGQILYAVTRDELTNQEGWQLEELLGKRGQWKDALSYAIFGNDLEDEKYFQGIVTNIKALDRLQ